MTSALSVRVFAGALLLFAAMAASSIANAQTGILMTVQQISRGGQFPGESTRSSPNASTIAVKSWSYSLKFPVDERSGTLAGQRRYAPVSFEKPIGAASPSFLRAMLANEPLSITVDLVGIGPQGTPVLLHRVTFNQARIISIARNATASIDGRSTSATPTEMNETITFDFRQVEFDPGRGNATVMDDLNTEG